MTLFAPGATFTGAISYPDDGDLSLVKSEASITVSFTTTHSTAVLAWGGHIAAATDWGQGNSASAISGSPYHMRTVSWNLGSLGSHD